MTIAEQFHAAVMKAAKGEVFFLTGGGGVGKTHELKKVVEKLTNVVIFAFTGDAALLARGKTGNSTFGIPTDKRWNPAIRTAYAIDKARSTDKCTKGFRGRYCKKTKKFKKSNRQQVLEACNYLVLDEASMDPGDHGDAIDVIMRDAKKEPHLPFGGCVVILVGDRGQIPPVIDKDDEKTLLGYGYKAPFDFFTARVFEKVEIQRFQLTKIHRQKNLIDGNRLNRVRIGSQTPQDLDRFNENICDEAPEGATVLCCENKDAARINSEKLSTLKGEPYLFSAKLTGTLIKKYKSKQTHITLKKNCRVIVASSGTCHHDGPYLDYVNGDQGTFHGVTPKGKLIVYIPRLRAEIYLATKKLEDVQQSVVKDGLTKTNEAGEKMVSDLLVEKVVGTYQQFPIRLGYAMSGHKAQGKTLTRVHIYLGKDYRSPVLKTYGYIYVLLSRVTSLDNLSLDRELEMEDIMTSPELIREEAQQQGELQL